MGNINRWVQAHVMSDRERNAEKMQRILWEQLVSNPNSSLWMKRAEDQYQVLGSLLRWDQDAIKAAMPWGRASLYTWKDLFDLLRAKCGQLWSGLGLSGEVPGTIGGITAGQKMIIGEEFVREVPLMDVEEMESA